MNLCSDNHDEVCYEGRTCPACAVAAEKDKEIADLERTNRAQLDDILELTQQLEEAKADLKEE